MKLMMKVQVFGDEGGAATHAFTEFPVRIGRDDGCELRVKHRRASRRHARIERVEDGLGLVDEGSRNGVLRNGERVSPREPVKLEDGDRLVMGPITVTVRIIEQTEPIRIDPSAAARAAPSNGWRPNPAIHGRNHMETSLPQVVTRTTQLSDLAPDVAFRAPIAARAPRRAPEPGFAGVSDHRPQTILPRRLEMPGAKPPTVDSLLDRMRRGSPVAIPRQLPETRPLPQWIARFLSDAARRLRGAVGYLAWLLRG
jgi:predicted component of type VI protein secretion system